jgi:transcriptional regulator with XRE-family HTH domain
MSQPGFGMLLGENICRLRKAKRLTQAELGQLVGTSGPVIGRYERGEMTPSVEAVARIADALDISMDYLVGRTAVLIDSEMMRRLQGLDQLVADQKSFVLSVFDIFLGYFSVRLAYER